ncbi:hypothetical protein [Methylomonas sp. AM2-LC]|uniref:hypothetical protein n=1 Tax=Methylomonas sp. AM2-LC TaxID=3153301 RepID=UPI0032643F1E
METCKAYRKARIKWRARLNYDWGENYQPETLSTPDFVRVEKSFFEYEEIVELLFIAKDGD